ncbi:response regulator [Xanthomonas vesicatoria]|uniref:Response regulator n=2 Tax=Xanthomonas vesicatoria TaxID=56460 RepID=A0AAJ0N2F4_9XANT|nr:response regulator [Xanthomonas vesicatoria]APO96611.1 response regulator [Xanthomonas vesicatoria]APP76705.1 response regulator [Xanthomonas vesicatoria ATCC 35937]EGD08659.1 response regulator containing a CheY-like receiver domain and a GGDEF domain [Xanthomonas vesicatoria ATCC 35937]KHM90884.1 transcriptional regulator [Xanthomonas vesicatoria]KHM96969.1 transcriptional regulator [Xanthomonas vesicatoria]
MTRDEILGSRILIVDDEPANVRLLEDLLQREGFQQVIATTDPLRVMGLVSAFAPDLILLDLKMPELDGYALLEQLARLSDPEHFLPVIVLTADPSRSARHRALGLGAKDFLTKPLDTFEVALRVWNVAETTVLFKRLRALAAPEAAPPGWRQPE